MIIRAAISHYKSVQDAQLIFRDINILVGPNGSGKSNLLDAIYFLHDCASDDIDTAVTKRHGIDSIRQWSRTRPYNISIELGFRNENGTGVYKIVISSSKGHYRILEEKGSWHGPAFIYRTRNLDEEKTFVSTFDRDEQGDVKFNSTVPDAGLERYANVGTDDLFLNVIAGRLPVPGLMHFRPIVDELTSFAKYNIYPNTLREAQLVSRETTLAEDGSNLSSVLKAINGNKRYGSNKEDILTSLRIIMPNITDFQVKSAGGYYVPVLRVEESNGDSHDFNLSQISDGTLRTLGLLTAFYQPSAPTKIGVEEPEQMVHPGALTVLQEAITAFVATQARRPRQVFVTTHSPTLIDLFPPQSIIWALFKNGVTECGHVRKRQLDIIKEQLFTAGELLIAEGLY